MAFAVKAGSFNLQASTGNQAITGVGFQPKLVIFLSNNQNAAGLVDSYDIGLGAAVSSSSRFAGSAYIQDALNTTVDLSVWGRGACIYLYRSVSDYAIADLVTMGADGFTVNVTVAPPATRKILYLALGGDDVTNVKLGYVDVNTSTGAQAITGLGFQPDALIFSGFLRGTTENSPAGDTSHTIGVATASAQRASCFFGRNGVPLPVERRAQSASKCILQCNSTQVSSAVSLTTLDADGFTLNVDTAPSSTFRVGYIAIEGINVAVGSFLQPDATGSQWDWLFT